MANDTMFITNRITGERLPIAKHLGTGWYSRGISKDSLMNFFRNHYNEFFDDPHAYFIEYDEECENSEHASQEKCSCDHLILDKKG